MWPTLDSADGAIQQEDRIAQLNKLISRLAECT